MLRKFEKILVFLLAAVILALSAPLCALAEENGDYKLLALTFDDGPGAYTAELLDALAERDVKATFFVVGTNAERYPELLERMAKEGHQLGNHTYDHAYLTKLSVTGIQDDLNSCRALLASAGGEELTYYVRPPYGSVNSTVKSAAEAPLVMWSVDPYDWKYRNADTVSKNILNAAKDGDIILLHDIHKTSVEAAVIVIDRLQAQGYEFVTVSELLRRRGIEAENGVIYRYARNNGINLGPYVDPEAYDETLIEMHPAYASLRFARYTGIFSGAEGDPYYPNKYLSRGMLSTVLGRFDGADVSGFTGSAFSDVPAESYYSPYIAWAAEKGYMSGYGGGLFGADDTVTREQLAVVLARYMRENGLYDGAAPAANYTDGDIISEWARDGIDVCADAGILLGSDDGSYNPRAFAVRWQCAIVFERLLKRADAEAYELAVAGMNGEVPPAQEALSPEPPVPDGTEKPEDSAVKLLFSEGAAAAAGVVVTAALFVKDKRKK